eukprot:m.1059439 g.1059439  ORF g.1059439 m.1059439 type:complete len:60 (-) comp24209_c0_seq15:2466-2645(-)
MIPDGRTDLLKEWIPPTLQQHLARVSPHQQMSEATLQPRPRTDVHPTTHGCAHELLAIS